MIVERPRFGGAFPAASCCQLPPSWQNIAQRVSTLKRPSLNFGYNDWNCAKGIIRLRCSKIVTRYTLIIVLLIAGCGQNTDDNSPSDLIVQAPVLVTISSSDKAWISRFVLDRIGFDKSIDPSRYTPLAGEVLTDQSIISDEDEMFSIQCLAELADGQPGETFCFRHEGITANGWTPIHGEIVADFGSASGLVSCLRFVANNLTTIVVAGSPCNVYDIVSSED